MRRKPEKLKALHKQLGLTAFIPPQGAVQLAQKRIENFVGYFHEWTSGMHYLGYCDALESMARSCYLQGVEDAAVAMARSDRQREG